MKNVAVAALLAVALLGGCRTLSGRTASQWADDHAITAKVKTRLVATHVATLTRVHVDTYEGVVYLTGGVDTEALKMRAQRIAGDVPNVQMVVNNLHVADGGGAVTAASPRTEVAPPTRPSPLADVRLEMDTGTPAWTRYAGYDAGGQRVATIYAVATSELTARGVGDLIADGRPVDHVAIYPKSASESYVVLWHVARDEAGYTRRP